MYFSTHKLNNKENESNDEFPFEGAEGKVPEETNHLKRPAAILTLFNHAISSKILKIYVENTGYINKLYK